MKDYYRILGLSRESRTEAIRKAFLDRASACHPSRTDGVSDPVRFQELTEAYEVLGDPARRSVYDSLLQEVRDSARHAGTGEASGHESVFAEWSEIGNAQSALYAAMNPVEFHDSLKQDLRIGLGYWPSLLLVSICVLAALSGLRVMDRDDSGIGILIVIIFGTLAYLLWDRARKDFLAERRHMRSKTG